MHSLPEKPSCLDLRVSAFNASSFLKPLQHVGIDDSQGVGADHHCAGLSDDGAHEIFTFSDSSASEKQLLIFFLTG